MDKRFTSDIILIMKEGRLNYIFRQGAHEIFEIFASMLDVRSAFFTPQGVPIYSGARLPMCDYCRMLRQKLGMEDPCHKQDLQAIDKAQKNDDLVAYSCHGGMQEMAMPIHFEAKIIGYAIIGQFRNSHQNISPYAEMWRKKFGDDQLQKKYDQSPVIRDDKIELLQKLFRHSVRSIETESMIVLKDYDLISPLIDQINQCPEQNLSLEDATRIIGRSKSTINRLFNTITGLSFRQFQIHTRLEKAKMKMMHHPHLPVTQIAEELGFDDPFYFSRLFKKHTGKTAVQFRENAKSEQTQIKPD